MKDTKKKHGKLIALMIEKVRNGYTNSLLHLAFSKFNFFVPDVHSGFHDVK